MDGEEIKMNWVFDNFMGLLYYPALEFFSVRHKLISLINLYVGYLSLVILPLTDALSLWSLAADDTHNWICRWNWRCKVLYLSLNYSYSSSVSVSLSPFISSNSSVTPDFIPFPIYVSWLIISSMFLLINKTLVVTVLSHQPGKIPNMNWSNCPLLMLAIYCAITIHANE